MIINSSKFLIPNKPSCTHVKEETYVYFMLWYSSTTTINQIKFSLNKTGILLLFFLKRRTTQNLYCSKIETHVCLLFYIGRQTLYGVVYQHSNTRPHTASRTTQFSTYTNIQILSGLLCPPDLNPTEHIREDLDRCVQGRVNTHANTRESFHTLRQEWAAIPAQVIHNLIQSKLVRC